MSKNKTLKTSQSLIDWCDEQDKEGKELKIGWNGGGDSGWVYFEIDGQEESNEYTETLVNLMYEQLDYGSWAGEFQASGEAIYNSATKTFEGEDNYSEDTSMSYPVNIVVRIPKSIWFDTLGVSVDGWDGTQCEINLSVKNGFVTDEHTTIENEIEAMISKKLDEKIDEFSTKHQFRNIWYTEIINRSQFTEEGDELVYEIEDMDFGTYEEDQKYIILQLEENQMAYEKKD